MPQRVCLRHTIYAPVCLTGAERAENGFGPNARERAEMEKREAAEREAEKSDRQKAKEAKAAEEKAAKDAKKADEAAFKADKAGKKQERMAAAAEKKQQRMDAKAAKAIAEQEEAEKERQEVSEAREAAAKMREDAKNAKLEQDAEMKQAKLEQEAESKSAKVAAKMDTKSAKADAKQMRKDAKVQLALDKKQNKRDLLAFDAEWKVLQAERKQELKATAALEAQELETIATRFEERFEEWQNTLADLEEGFSEELDKMVESEYVEADFAELRKLSEDSRQMTSRWETRRDAFFRKTEAYWDEYDTYYRQFIARQDARYEADDARADQLRYDLKQLDEELKVLKMAEFENRVDAERGRQAADIRGGGGGGFQTTAQRREAAEKRIIERSRGQDVERKQHAAVGHGDALNFSVEKRGKPSQAAQPKVRTSPWHVCVLLLTYLFSRAPFTIAVIHPICVSLFSLSSFPLFFPVPF